MEDLEKAFETKSKDEILEEAEFEQLDDEDLECVRFGIHPEYLEDFTGKNAFWNGSPTNAFVEYLVEVYSIDELKQIELSDLSETQRDLIEEKLGKEPEQGATYPKTDKGRKKKVSNERLKAQVKQLTMGRDTLKTSLIRLRDALKEIIDVFIKQEITADISGDTEEVIRESLDTKSWINTFDTIKKEEEGDT